MSIQDLGAIGELIAAIAVVVSLVYLAVQIRQNTNQIEENTEAVRAAAVHSGVQLIFENRVAIFESGESAEIFYKGLESPDDLQPVERMRFRLMFANALDAIFNTYSHTHASGFSPETWSAQYETAKRLMLTAGGRWFWAEYKNEYRVDFHSEVERIFENDS